MNMVEPANSSTTFNLLKDHIYIMSEAGEEQAVSAPSQFLSEITGSKVIVKLYSGEEYHGKLLREREAER